MKEMNPKYVSFDVFGTLINRSIPIQQMFGLMGQVAAKNDIVKIDDFTKQRESAEQKAREKYGNNYNLQEIYQCFSPKLSDRQIGELMKLEQKFEIINSERNQQGYKLFEKYKKTSKIIAISDMYLDSKTIGKMLIKNGYTIDKIYVSSEYRKSKKEKDLYGEVAEELGVTKKDMLHIGDAVRSDYLNAKSEGIKSRLIRGRQADYFYNFGFKVLGPVMYNFCRWIKEKVEQSDCKKVLFVSREGEVVRKFYAALYEEPRGDTIYLSRKSILSGVSGILLKKYNISQIIEMISLKRNETFGDFLIRLGLEPKRYTEDLNECGINENTFLKDVDAEDFFKKYKDKIAEDLKVTSEIFNKYLNDNLSESNLLIDIGWKGSMQDLLAKYLTLTGSTKKISGLYLGCMDSKNKVGFLFDKNDKTCQETLNYSGLLEAILMPEHGSVIGYKRQGKKIAPVFDKTEFSDESMNKIKKIQQGALDFITKMREFGDGLTMDVKIANDRLNRFGNAPTIQDIKMLGGIDFYDNGHKYYLAKIDWRDLKTSFLDCKWKTAFLKKMFRINLPYDKIVIALRRVGDKNV